MLICPEITCYGLGQAATILLNIAVLVKKQPRWFQQGCKCRENFFKTRLLKILRLQRSHSIVNQNLLEQQPIFCLSLVGLSLHKNPVCISKINKVGNTQ